MLLGDFCVNEESRWLLDHGNFPFLKKIIDSQCSSHNMALQGSLSLGDAEDAVVARHTRRIPVRVDCNLSLG